MNYSNHLETGPEAPRMYLIRIGRTIGAISTARTSRTIEPVSRVAMVISSFMAAASVWTDRGRPSNVKE